MPAKFEIDKKNRLVRSRAWGEVTFDDIAQHQHKLRAHPDFDATFDQLGEFTDVASVHISAEGIRLLANQKLFSASSRLAFVAGSQFAYGMLRMFQAHHGFSPNSSNMMVFSNAAEALSWLRGNGNGTGAD